ncbi:hypothetical protein [Rhodovulum visakhapatnamense]|nr:hypothetical protein [Rhodovulum visakhapatnamense]
MTGHHADAVERRDLTRDGNTPLRREEVFKRADPVRRTSPKTACSKVEIRERSARISDVPAEHTIGVRVGDRRQRASGARKRPDHDLEGQRQGGTWNGAERAPQLRGSTTLIIMIMFLKRFARRATATATNSTPDPSGRFPASLAASSVEWNKVP